MERLSYLTRVATGAAVAAALALGATGASAQKITMKLGHPLPPKTGLHQWALYFKEGVELRAGDKIEVKIFPVSQLGKIPRMIEGAQLGTIEMITIPPGFFTGLDSRFGVLAAPGIFHDIAHGQRTVHDPEFKKVFWGIGDSKGLKLVSMSCDGPVDYATTKPIRKIADFRGRKLRVFGSKLEIETLRRVGATGVPMPLAEVIPAIQQNVIDGNKAAIVVFVPFRYQTVAKYVLVAKESIICITRFVSKVWFDGLPGDLQQVILEEAAKADERVLPFNISIINRLYGVWTKTGGVLTHLSDTEQEELRQRLSTVGDDVLKEDPKALSVYKVMKSVAARQLKNQ